MNAAVALFELSQRFPESEKYAFTDQIRRASQSVPSNISEAWRKRRYAAAFVSKLCDAEAEAAEVQTRLGLGRRFRYIQAEDAARWDKEYEEILAMLSDMANHPEQWVLW